MILLVFLLIGLLKMLVNSTLQGVPKKIEPRLCGYCGGAVDTMISRFTFLHRSGFKLEFETSYESI